MFYWIFDNAHVLLWRQCVNMLLVNEEALVSRAGCFEHTTRTAWKATAWASGSLRAQLSLKSLTSTNRSHYRMYQGSLTAYSASQTLLDKPEKGLRVRQAVTTLH